MSSGLQSAVSSIVENDYVTIVILTAVAYDYILTFANEIEYIWTKPWTRVSTLFVLVRYFGLCGVMIFTLIGSSVLPGPAETYVFILFARYRRLPMTHLITMNSCKLLTIIGQWALCIFTGAADLAMIFRVWAVYTQSSIILGILLILYALEIVPLIIGSITTSIKLTVITGQVLDLSFCITDVGGFPILAEVIDILEFILSATLCLLVIGQFVRQALQMHTVAKKWQVNRYMNLFAREGILYFLAVLVYALVNLLLYVVKLPLTGWHIFLVAILESVPIFTLTPRFILSVRALYARDVQGRRASRGIDSEFGFTSVHVHSVGRIAFAPADVGRSEEDMLEDDEGIRVVERETWNSV